MWSVWREKVRKLWLWQNNWEKCSFSSWKHRNHLWPVFNQHIPNWPLNGGNKNGNDQITFPFRAHPNLNYDTFGPQSAQFEHVFINGPIHFSTSVQYECLVQLNKLLTFFGCFFSSVIIKSKAKKMQSEDDAKKYRKSITNDSVTDIMVLLTARIHTVWS